MPISVDLNLYKSKDKVPCNCDFCGCDVLKVKDKIIKAIKSKKLLCCNKKECRLEKTKKTNISKYGVEFPTQNNDIKNKLKSTNLEKYGVEWGLSSEDIKSKQRLTNIERYGFENCMQNEYIRKKAENTTIDRYGVKNCMQNKDIQNKVKKTNIEKYGTECSLLNEEVKQKVKNTNIEKYGTSNPVSLDCVQEKIRNTCLEKYGTYFPLKTNKTTQNFIRDWLKSIGFEFKSILVGSKEIDLFNEELSFGIEYCGLYWHNELSPEPRNKTYHYDKYKLCMSNGVRLITIFEDEWIHRERQVKGYLSSVLNVFDKKIFARNCNVVELNKSSFNDFVNLNHIQGASNLYLKCFGLTFNGEVVGAMSFSRHHRKSGQLVLSRLCFKERCQVVGGASKLFSHAVKWATLNKYKNVISWSDNRWSLGTVYEKMGFTLEKELNPDYSYVRIKNENKLRYPKQSCKKSNIGCPKNITEKKWMSERGYARIWDCGKKRWAYQFMET